MAWILICCGKTGPYTRYSPLTTLRRFQCDDAAQVLYAVQRHLIALKKFSGDSLCGAIGSEMCHTVAGLPS